MNTSEQYKDTTLPGSFVGLSGKFYIRQNRADGSGYNDRVTVWPSVENYNQRTGVPLFCSVADAQADFSYETKINPESLTTIWPTDRDETDLGLTPKRNIWLNKFEIQKAKEGRLHAA